MTRRADAEENRTALLEAAAQVFAETGIDAPLDLVRRRADVGRGTLYRHFADRRTLFRALVELSLARLEACVVEDDPAALANLLRLAALESARTPALHAIWDALREDPDAADLVGRLTGIFARPMAQGQAAGWIDAALTVDDLFLAVRMLGAASRGPDLTTRAADARRALAILIAGLGLPRPPSQEMTDDR